MFALALLSLSAPACIAGPPEPNPPWAESLRPMPTARCPYGIDALYTRIGQLLALTDGQLGRETVERIFAIPPMTTQFDDSRNASYAVQLGGEDGWKLRIDFSEAFYPSSGPAEFTPALRPARIHPRRRGEMQLSLLLLEPPPATCLTTDAAHARLEATGWRLQPPQMVMDSGPVPGGYRRGRRMSVLIDGVGASPCLRSVRMGQTPPGG